MDLTFDQAIELLEITDIHSIKEEDIPQLEKRVKRRWHPDKVAHLKDEAVTQEYTLKFQQVESACQMILSFIQGTYKAGENFTHTTNDFYEEPEDVVRRNAPDMQAELASIWNIIKEKKYKLSIKEVLLSDGFKLKDILKEDFKEDIAMLSVVSFIYGLVFFAILAAIAGAIHPILGTIVGIVWLAHVVSCVFGFAPLSRFWLNQQVAEVMYKFINFGLALYNWAEDQTRAGTNGWIFLLVQLPVLFAKAIKYFVLLPLYELAKIFIGDKVIGVVKKNVDYYADVAEWYIEDLIRKSPSEMIAEELFHLSYVYSELRDAKFQ